MARGSTEPIIFVSYSHKDEPLEPSDHQVQWLSYVMRFLTSALPQKAWMPWSDQRLIGSQDWDARISDALTRCDGFVFLVSSNSLTSKYIVDVEISRILERQRNAGTTEYPFLYPLVISPAAGLNNFPWLTVPLRRPKDGMALSDFEQSAAIGKRDRVMKEVADEIAALARTAVSLGAQLAGGPHRQIPTPVVDITRLPETPYKRLVGREAEISELDAAFSSESTVNILSLIAWGGSGKTTLINDWLKRLQFENYRDAEFVLGWSFYDQGTKERATSADLFLEWCLKALGIESPPKDANAKGDVLSRLLKGRRILILLDGVEPLQYGPGSQEGFLKDAGLRSFLRRFAAEPPSSALGLVVLTSRLAVRDLGRESTPGGSAPVLRVERLSEDAGAELLAENGVIGTPESLRHAAREFDGHALALSLLAGFLTRRHGGDVERRRSIGPLLVEEGRTVDEQVHGHAKRVMRSIEAEWLSGHPALQEIMALVSVFDRPAPAELLRVLRAEPTISGLTDSLANLSNDDWLDAIADLRAVRLLAPTDASASNNIDAHPLVRDWFSSQLEQRNKPAWRAAHQRLYEYLLSHTPEEAEPSLVTLQPLYQAISHACKAGKYQQALTSIYFPRISKSTDDGELQSYSIFRLGLSSTDLAILSQFFETPYQRPHRSIHIGVQQALLFFVSHTLVNTGRLLEAEQTQSQLIKLLSQLRDRNQIARWNFQMAAANGLSAVTKLYLGKFNEATQLATTATTYGAKSVKIDAYISTWGTRIIIAYYAGQIFEAKNEVQKIRARLDRTKIKVDKQWQHDYVDWEILLRERKWDSAIKSAQDLLDFGSLFSLSGNALALLVKARARLGKLLEFHYGTALDAPALQTYEVMTMFDEALENIKNADEAFCNIVGYLGRAHFRMCSGDWPGAKRDIDEAEDLAARGPFKLLEAEVWLRSAQLDLFEFYDFRPISASAAAAEYLNGRSETLREAAKDKIHAAGVVIERGGLLLRESELRELQGALKQADVLPTIALRV